MIKELSSNSVIKLEYVIFAKFRKMLPISSVFGLLRITPSENALIIVGESWIEV